MKVNFIGGFFPKDKMSEYIQNSSGVIHYAANSLQQSIITGLKLFPHIETKLITAPFLVNYPQYKKIFIKGEKKSDYQTVPFINIKLIDSFSKTWSLNKIIKKEIPNDKDNNIILVYGMFDYFLKAIPKKYNNKVCLVVPDLPRMMGGDLNNLKIKLYLGYIESIINENLYKIDCFVFISKFMTDYVDVKGKPWIVIEGIYNNQQIIEDQLKEVNNTILYTGTLDIRYGIIELLESFSLISDKNFNLWICGEGAGKSEVLIAASKDSRINYYGQISTEEVLILQRKATVLVNPRKNDMEFTKFSFPSKTMEYLASGTPVVMYKLDGIPEEYYPYFFTPEDNSVMALKNKLLEVVALSNDERKKFGRVAQKFIFENKNPKMQVGKIINMISELL